MWHFDSRANAAYLKNVGMSRNITLIEGEYQHSNLDHQGNIASLVLDGERVIPLDWVLDCSGFARLLLEKVMGVGKKDYTDILPARAVIAWWDKPKFNSATIATAMDAGWSWQIGIKHRTGQGYLYDPDILTSDQALVEIRSKFGEHVEPVASIKFSPCVLDQFQKKNVIGVGLSTGFLEPLEANGVGVITDSLEFLKQLWDPWATVDEFPKEFNQLVAQSYEAIKNFLSLHYRGKGLETRFWKEHQTNPIRIPDSLSAKIDEIKEFYCTGAINPFNYAGQYSLESWITVVNALDIVTPDLIPKHESNEYILEYYARQKTLNMQICKEYIGIEEWSQKF
jgi:tryptophan halogenase